jgi:hypothetical protein
MTRRIQGIPHAIHPLRSHRQGRRHHRLEPRHRPVSAELLAKLGARVVISSRKADACEAVASGIRKDGGDAHVIPCNISRKPEVEALISGATQHYGKVDILVCTAAVNP